ncbi:hypothetical protein [Thermomonospora amylolytica]|uniref:hypothetical protein n=1 Tax=Thermomonospora amylolytica TaxID=1411117 RepID=UPI000E6CFF81|nr:hypothetical protein [Thermomonospora amylolytica]
MTIEQQHPDPITEGLVHTGQRLVQCITISVLVRQIQARYEFRRQRARRLRNLQAERHATQTAKAAFEQARTRWAPAHDPEWLKHADLLRVAEAWSAALPYAADHALAASAVRKCEQRLRELHPHAMQHYDRYRQNGLSPEEAMRETIPFFTRTPNVRTGEPAAERPALLTGTGTRWTTDHHSPDRQDHIEHRQRHYAAQLINALRAHHLIQGLDDLSDEDLHTALKTTTNLPEHVIAQAIRQVAEQSKAGTTPATATPRPASSMAGETPPNPTQARTPGQVAADDFPYDIREAIHLATQQPLDTPAPRRPHPNTHTRHRRPTR